LHTTVACPHDTQRRPGSSEGLKKRLGDDHTGSTRYNLGFDLGFDLGLNSSLDLDLRLGLGLGCDGFGGALNQLSVDSRTLNQPVVPAMASDTLVNARLTEIKVSVIACGTVVMNIGDGHLAAVATNCETGHLIEIGQLIGRKRKGLRNKRVLLTMSRVKGLGSVVWLRLSFHKVSKSALKILAGVLSSSDVLCGIAKKSRIVGPGQRVDTDRKSGLRRCNI
jgi:hypothetical protein